MDPTANIRQQLSARTRSERRELAATYAEWRAKGGFAARVELAPHLDAWMAGDRFGNVVKVTDKRIHVRMDRSGRMRMLGHDDVTLV